MENLNDMPHNNGNTIPQTVDRERDGGRKGYIKLGGRQAAFLSSSSSSSFFLNKSAFPGRTSGSSFAKK